MLVRPHQLADGLPVTPLLQIIAATDLSPRSRHAVRRAAQIAADTGAQCTLLHALGMDEAHALAGALAPFRRSLPPALSRRAHAELDAVAATERGTHPGLAIKARVDRGVATQALPALAHEAAADLVVIGPRGEGLARRMLLGSTASRLLRQTRYPVLVARHAPKGPYRRVLVAVDFSPGSLAIVQMARRVAPAAKLVLLHAFEAPFEGLLAYAGVDDEALARYQAEAKEAALTRLQALAREAGLTPGDYLPVVRHGNALRILLERQRRLACDLIALGKHGTGVTEELLLGSLTERVLAEAPVDVLVVVDPRPPTLEAA